jgi:hypothetical protein
VEHSGKEAYGRGALVATLGVRAAPSKGRGDLVVEVAMVLEAIGSESRSHASA